MYVRLMERPKNNTMTTGNNPNAMRNKSKNTQRKNPLNNNNNNKNNNMNRTQKKSPINNKIPGSELNPWEMFQMSNGSKKVEPKKRRNTIHFGAGMKFTLRYFPKHMQLVDKKNHMYAIYFQIIPYFNGMKMSNKPSRKYVE